MNPFTAFFIVSLVLWASVSLWLSRRHEKHVATHRERVPGEFSERVSVAEHRRAADYTIARVRFGRLELIVGAVLLVLWTLGGLLDSIDGFWQQRDWPEVLTGAVVIASVLLISAIIDIPASKVPAFKAGKSLEAAGEFHFNIAAHRLPGEVLQEDECVRKGIKP